MGLVGHLAAEGDREAQGGAGRLAEPGGEQQGGRGALAEARQGDVAAVRGGHRGVAERRPGVAGSSRCRRRRRGPCSAGRAGRGGKPWTKRSGRPSDSNQRSPAQFRSSSVRGRSTTCSSRASEAPRPSPARSTSSRWASTPGAAASEAAASRKAHSGVAVRSSSRAAPPISRSSTVTTAPIDRTCARSSSRSGRWPGALYTVSKRACSRSAAVRPRPLRRTTPSGARSAQSAATASSRAVRPEPGWPVRRTLRPRASSRTRRSRSSSRSRRGGWGAGVGLGTGERRRVRGRRARRGCGGRGRRARSPAARPRPRCRPRG